MRSQAAKPGCAGPGRMSFQRRRPWRPRGRRLGSDEGTGCVMSDDSDATYAERVSWEAARPRWRPLRLLLALVIGAVAVIFASLVLPGVEVKTFLGALKAAVLIAVLNAVLPPLVAALRLPFMLIIGFLAVLILDALILLLVSHLAPDDFKVDSFGWALLAALVISAASMVFRCSWASMMTTSTRCA